MNELKPCPFCGERAILEHRKEPGLTQRWAIYCANAESNEVVEITGPTRAKAITRWNRRLGKD